MLRFKKLFPSPCSLIGMIHVDALPGTPLYKGCLQSIIKKAQTEAELYLNNGIDGIIVENMHDIPYIQSNKFGPETTANMTRICSEVASVVRNNIPCGVQVLAGGNKEAIAIAQACAFDFIRCEGYVFAHVADEGLMNAQAGELMRYRKHIGADNVLVFTDIKKKHSSHAITNDVSLLETANAASFFLSDAVIVTGTATGSPVSTPDLLELKKHYKFPVVIGSGVTLSNVEEYLHTDALIVGSYFKRNNQWQNDIDEDRVKNLIVKVKNAIN